MKQFNFRIVCAALPLFCTTQIVFAEGSTRDAGDGVAFGGGNNGVNRVVRTGPGFTGLQIVLNNLSFRMPANEAGRYEVLDAQGEPVLDGRNNGQLDLEVQPFFLGNDAQGDPRRPQGNKPSAYLGGEFRPLVSLGNNRNTGLPYRTQVDVGLQYEPITLSNTAPGWSVFFYLHNVGYIHPNGNNATADRLTTNPRVWSTQALVPNEGIPYRAGGSAINGTMTLDARDSGSVGFTFSPMGEIFFNFRRDQLPQAQQARWDVNQNRRAAPWGDATQPALRVFDTNLYNEANVKRVTAMTRDSPYHSELDGSQVVTQWSQSQVRPNGGALRNWAAADVAQDRTGYDVTRQGNLAWDKRFEGQRTSASQTIVQFSPNLQNNEQLRSPQGTNDARYLNEDVTLNLGTIARPIGEAVK